MTTILIVDDEIGIRSLLSEILNDEGYQTDIAENAQQARDYRLRKNPDLVLLDIWMPDTDGVTLLKEWATQDLLTMPVIMMSGHATIDTAIEATQIGALDFLEKPIALQKLLKAVKHGLTHKRLAAFSARQKTATSSTLAQPAENSAAISFDAPLRVARDAFERAYFTYHLACENGSITRIAERTGLERTHLYRKLKQLGVEWTKNKAG
jgi:DNA-binding NtrC family response regulator